MIETKKNSRRAILRDLCLRFPGGSSPADEKKQTQEGVPIEPKEVHAGLWLDKYITNLESYKGGSQNESEGSPQQRLVHDVAKLQVPEVYTRFYRRWRQILRAAGVDANHMREFTAKSRLAVGLGNEGVLETSVALHRTYGVPYIPGSALKGLAASYARLMAGEDWQQDSYAYKVVFGDTENAGYITFFDALYIPGSARQNSPAQSNSQPDCPLRPDIITVHHPGYYQERKDAKGKRVPPADWDSPTPIPFLSATGSYLIALAAPDLNDTTWIEKTFDLLSEALLILGIGAKTSSGYGRMEYSSDDAGRLTEEEQHELQTINVHLEKIQKMPDGQVTSQIRNIGVKCLLLKSPVARKTLARAIIEKVRQAGVEDGLKGQPWYQSVLKY